MVEQVAYTATMSHHLSVCAAYTLTQVVQEFLGSVLSGLEVEEFLVLVDELGIHGGVEELVIGKDVLEERDVGLEMKRQMDKQRGEAFNLLSSLMSILHRGVCECTEVNVTT